MENIVDIRIEVTFDDKLEDDAMYPCQGKTFRQSILIERHTLQAKKYKIQINM